MNGPKLFCLYVLRGCLLGAAIALVMCIFDWQVGLLVAGFYGAWAGISYICYKKL